MQSSGPSLDLMELMESTDLSGWLLNLKLAKRAKRASTKKHCDNLLGLES